MAKKSHKKQSFRKILIATLILASFIGLIFYIRAITATKQLQIITTIYEKARPLIGPDTILEKNTDGKMWWVTDDGYNIIIPTNDSITFKTKANKINETDQNQIDFVMKQPGMNKFYDLATENFERDGFRKNQENSSSSFSDNKFYDYILAFKKGPTRCTITTSPDAEGQIGSDVYYYSTTVSCSNDFEKHYNQQIPILKSLNIKNAVIYNTQKHVGDYYYFNINYRRTGYYMIAKKNGNKYVEIFSGQDAPPCDLMNENQVPEKLYDYCYMPSQN